MTKTKTKQHKPGCTAYIENHFSHGLQQCTLEAGHQEPAFGDDHAGPENELTERYRWDDAAIGAVPDRRPSGGRAVRRGWLNERVPVPRWIAMAGIAIATLQVVTWILQGLLWVLIYVRGGR